MGAGRALAVACLAALLAGCPQTPSSPDPVPPGQKPPAKDHGQYFELQGKRPGHDMAGLIAKVKARLAAFGVQDVQVAQVAERTIHVFGVDGIPAQAERVEHLVTRPVAMAIAPVDPGKSFFEKVAAELPAKGGLKVAMDKLGDLANNKVARIWYLAANDPNALDAYLKTATPPAGLKLLPMRGTGGAVAYLIPDPPPIPNPIVTKVVVEGGADDAPVVVAELAKHFQRPFRDLVKANMHRPLAFIVDGQVVALPVVASKSRRGELRIEPSPLADPAQARSQAERLAAKLYGWQIIGTFKKVSYEDVKFNKPQPLREFGRSGLPE